MIVILGSRGYVGQAFLRELERSNEVYVAPTRHDVDIACVDSLSRFLHDCPASFVINCTGFTGKPNVDACEHAKAECLFANAVLPGRIREACDRAGVPFGHVSSGCIFEGSRPDGSGFVESDIPNFCFRSNHCSFYSGTKALGEEVLADCSSCFIWRPRMPFHEIDSPRNYLSKLMTYERILNATNSLSHLDEFAKICLECWRRRCEYGIYNVVNTGSVTTKQIVSLLQKYVAIGKRFEYFESEKEFLRLAAIAPRSNCVLDNAKLRRTGIPVRSIEDALLDAIQRWNRN
jgi:dTDP-4-dehydrorhamnose reductase